MKNPDTVTSPSAWYELFFFKLDAFSTSILYTRYIRLTDPTQQLYLKRIMISQKRTFTTSATSNPLSDNVSIYFCGATSLRNGDYIYGKLDSSLNPLNIY